MNETIITKSDRKKFIALLKKGFESGSRQEMKIYSSLMFDNHNEYYVSLEFKFRIPATEAAQIVADDDIDNEIRDALSDIKP